MTRANSTYFIIKLRVYASKYYLNLWHKKGNMLGHKKHCEACDKHNKFFIKFYEHVTGQSYRDILINYAYGTKECAVEILESEHNVVLGWQGEEWFSYLIPKTNTELIQWILDNKGDIPFKIMKRSRIILDFHKPSTRNREMFKTKEDMKEFYKKAHEQETEIQPEGT